jgi:GNAT superfamily N-acetyltransferase
MTQELRLVPTSYGDPVVRELEAQIQHEYVCRYGGADLTATDAAEFDPPSGVFLVGWAGDEAVATGGLRRHDSQVAEVKRMYVVAEHRGRGFARAVLAGLERWAVDHGYRQVLLETGTAQPEAISLYVSSGYQPVDGFGHYRDSPLSRSFSKCLQP